MKDINTLISDIYLTLQKKDGWFTDELAEAYATDLSKRLQVQLNDNRDRRTLRLSQMGPRCPCALWHSIHHPELAEKLPAWVEVKYSFGHMIEALAIILAKAAGHEVTGEQDRVELDGIPGHRDCVVDGCTLDVKSASSIGFNKFKNSGYEKVDSFGYMDQLDGYVVASRSDPLVRVKDKGYILAVDKQLGHMVLYEHSVTTTREETLRARIVQYKHTIASKNPPPCECKTVPQGASGNLQLDIRASYSPYKYCCHPFLRTFLYANGPVFLTKVVKRPFNKDGPIIEIDKNGKAVYN